MTSPSGPARPRRRPRRAPSGSAPAGQTGRQSSPSLPPVSSFSELGLPAEVLAVLAREGIAAPFPIQAAALPDAMAGRDILGRGRTGSGKTIAFSLPTVARLGATPARREPGRPRALVLVPTRELAAQVAATLKPLAGAVGLRVATVVGGVSQGPQTAALRRGTDVLVATPGRLEDLIGQGICRLDSVEVTVLDEADHMADLGFLPSVTRLLDQTPPGTQRLLFSATLDGGVDKLVTRYLDDPAVHSVDEAEDSPAELDHHLFLVAQGSKAQVVTELASGLERALLFTRTKHGARKLARSLTSSGVPALDLQGNLSQSVRNKNLAAFTEGRVRVLVATDIAARGIHVDGIALVVHVDPPVEHKAYIHRSGRTARAGASGAVVTIVTPEQRKDVDAMVRRAGIDARRTEVAPGHPTVRDLTGPAAPLVTVSPTSSEPLNGRPGPVSGARPAPSGRPPRRTGGGGQARRTGDDGQARRTGGGGQAGRTGGGGQAGRTGTAGGGRSEPGQKVRAERRGRPAARAGSARPARPGRGGGRPRGGGR